MGFICPYMLTGSKENLNLSNVMHCIYTGTYGVILSKNCWVKSQWYVEFICPYVLWGSKENLKLYYRMLKHCIYN